MNITKKYLTLLFALFAFTPMADAQDLIQLNNGRKITGYVTQITDRDLSYSRAENEKRVYSISLRDIKFVEYENGEKEYFSARGKGKDLQEQPKHQAEDYGNNQIKYYPFHVNNHGLGMAFAYERSLDKKGILAIDLPLSYSFIIPFGQRTERPAVWGFYPNLKFYPTSSKGNVRYALGVGPAIEWGVKNFEDQVYDPNTGITKFIDGERTVERFGFMLNNSINMQPTPNFSIGLELGFGFLIDADSYYTNTNDVEIPMIRGGLRFGYRF